MDPLPPADTLILGSEQRATEPAAPASVPAYQILRQIGRGGMSTVHEARDVRTGQAVALKMLTLPPSHTAEQQQDLIARFRREARAVAQLSHPNIVVIHEVGEREGTHFLAMEYLTGETLRERLDSGPLTPAQAQPILDQIAGALDAVHSAGIIHRDVKPSNVMLLPDGTAKLLDFGIARQSDDTTITGTGVLVGSPSYMAPEQVLGEAGTASSDVWALGVLLYEMLAGGPPFSGPTIPAVLYQVSHASPPPIPGLPAALQRVLRKALNKNPARRFPSAGAFAEATRAALSLPSVPRTRSWAWVALLPLLLLGVGAGFLLHRRASVPARPVSARPAAARTGPVLIAPVARPVQTRSHKTTSVKNTALPAKPKQRKAPRVKPAAAPPRPPHRSHASAHRQAAHRPRRARPRYFRRPSRYTQRRSGGYDAAAAARLQRFIWPEGR